MRATEQTYAKPRHRVAPPDGRDDRPMGGSVRPTRRQLAVEIAHVLQDLPPVRILVGGLALAFSVLYFLSDVLEVANGGFSAGQLWLTLVAEAAVPVFVVGLAVLQRPQLGRLGMLSAWAYAYSYLVFSGTVVYALVNNTPDYQTLSEELGAVMLTHGAVMVFAGLGFGSAVFRARLLPRWTSVALMVGVVLVALAQGLPDGAQLVAAGVRDLGFAGMGAAVLRSRRVMVSPDDAEPFIDEAGAGARLAPMC